MNLKSKRSEMNKDPGEEGKALAFTEVILEHLFGEVALSQDERSYLSRIGRLV